MQDEVWEGLQEWKEVEELEGKVSSEGDKGNKVQQWQTVPAVLWRHR